MDTQSKAVAKVAGVARTFSQGCLDTEQITDVLQSFDQHRRADPRRTLASKNPATRFFILSAIRRCSE